MVVLWIHRRTRYLVRRIVRRPAVRFLPAHQKAYAHVDHLLPRGVLCFRGAGASDELWRAYLLLSFLAHVRVGGAHWEGRGWATGRRLC